MKSTVCFFDDYFITARPGTVRRTFKPEKIGYLNNKQSFLQTYTSMFYDPRVKKLRLYVEVPHYENDTEIRDLIMFEGDDISDFIGDGSKLSRAVVQGFPTFVHGSSVFYDERATDPGKRYVFAGNVDSYDLKKQRLAVAFSSDGINYTKVLEKETSGTTEEIEVYPLETGVTARFVKFVGHGSNAAVNGEWNNVLEMAALEKR